ncbi:hypothetical protein [Pseudanabaena sp. BC1403]|uniref:hypothetical protein n=1 Tax=Pseudanabaena sp. BC1403 TaxID=2043171 RepID=UPI000CD87BDA|nr:hypothetical protein [Pseudanabaena sp. BC1403]
MSNSISYEKRPDLHSVQMNNGLTSVFISVIAIAASTLAKNDLQRKIAVWFASHDQGVFGLGLVGFDVSELPWVQDNFDEQKYFILQVIDSTTCQMGWDILDYEPHKEWVFTSLEKFRILIEAFEIQDRCKQISEVWGYVSEPKMFILCPKHNVYEHDGGCVLCND